jgi:hypothetical protein
VSPFSLYYNWELVFGQGQIWRLVTSYLFFGVFSIDFLFHMYFLVGHIYIHIYHSCRLCASLLKARKHNNTFSHDSLFLSSLLTDILFIFI